MGDWSGLVGLMGGLAQTANQRDRQRRQAEAFAGLGYALEERRKFDSSGFTKAEIKGYIEETVGILLANGKGAGSYNDVDSIMRTALDNNYLSVSRKKPESRPGRPIAS